MRSGQSCKVVSVLGSSFSLLALLAAICTLFSRIPDFLVAASQGRILATASFSTSLRSFVRGFWSVGVFVEAYKPARSQEVKLVGDWEIEWLEVWFLRSRLLEGRRSNLVLFNLDGLAVLAIILPGSTGLSPLLDLFSLLRMFLCLQRRGFLKSAERLFCVRSFGWSVQEVSLSADLMRGCFWRRGAIFRELLSGSESL